MWSVVKGRQQRWCWRCSDSELCIGRSRSWHQAAVWTVRPGVHWQVLAADNCRHAGYQQCLLLVIDSTPVDSSWDVMIVQIIGTAVCYICRHSYAVERGLASVVNHTIVTDPTIRRPGFDLPRHTWSRMNHLQTGQGPQRLLIECQEKW